MSEIHIKPCPFCGSENISFNAFSILSDAYVLCEQCNASIEISVPWDDMDEKEPDKVCFEKLLVLWNKRASKSNQPELNENQQIVLDWLKDEYCDGNPFFTIWHTLEDRYFKGSSDALLASQQIEILQAFSQWALEQEEAE